MTKFTITSIDSGKILAREKNPYDREKTDNYTRIEWDSKYRWAEFYLKTYPLSDKGIKSVLKIYQNDLQRLIGQEIEGEVVNGEIVIK